MNISLIKFKKMFSRLYWRRGAHHAVSPSVQTLEPIVESISDSASASPPQNDCLENVLKDLEACEKRVYRIFARPLGFKASDVICEVTRKYKIGTKIRRIDGRVYEVYRRKKTKRMRLEDGYGNVWRNAM